MGALGPGAGVPNLSRHCILWHACIAGLGSMYSHVLQCCSLGVNLNSCVSQGAPAEMNKWFCIVGAQAAEL